MHRVIDTKNQPWHRPVMMTEVIEFLNLSTNTRAADLTLGEGGHLQAILDAGVKSVVVLDRDPQALSRYRERHPALDPRLRLVHGRFGEWNRLRGGESFDAILVDLGVSTRQLLEVERGFSFQGEATADMRMDPTAGEPLFERLKEVSEEELREVLETYAEIPRAGKVASDLIAGARRGTITTTAHLASVMGPRRGKIHPATQLFMALRMWVNDELGEIEQGLPQMIESLTAGGRLVVLSFHSVEDRLVKQLFRAAAGLCLCGQNPCLCDRHAVVRWVNKKALSPAWSEVKGNPRARSVKLRCVEKLPPAP